MRGDVPIGMKGPAACVGRDARRRGRQAVQVSLGVIAGSPFCIARR